MPNDERHPARPVAPTQNQDGWSAIAADLKESADAFSFLNVLRGLVGRPVEGAVALAEDAAYQGHVKFFSSAFAIWLGFGLVVLPRFVGWYLGSDEVDFDPESTGLKVALLQYLEIAVSVPLGFFLYRLGATAQRSPRSYFKLTLIGGGLALLLSIAMQATRMLGIIAIREATPEDIAFPIIQSPALIALVNIAMFAAVTIFAMILNRRYWGLRWRFVIPVALLIAAIDIAVVAAAASLLQGDGIDKLFAIVT